MEILLEDILLGYVPEIALSFLILTAILNKLDFKSKSIWLKLIISIIVLLLAVIYIRNNVSSIIYISLSSTLIYTLIHRYIWRYNWRKSLFGSLIAVFLVMSLETLTTPMMILMIDQSETISLFNNRFILFLPARILQLSILILLITERLTLKDNPLFTLEFSKLSRNNKITVFTLFAAVLICNVFNVNYNDLFVKTNLTKSSLNLQSYMVLSIFLSIILFILISRTIRHEEYKRILNLSDRECLKGILSNSSLEELHDYSKILFDELHIAKVIQIQRHLENIKKEYTKLTYKIDESIVIDNYDYTSVIKLAEYLINTLPFYTDINFKIEKEDKIEIILEADCNELQFKNLENYYKNELKNLAKEIFLKLKGKVCICYSDNKCEVKTVIPISIIYRKEGNSA